MSMNPKLKRAWKIWLCWIGVVIVGTGSLAIASHSEKVPLTLTVGEEQTASVFHFLPRGVSRIELHFDVTKGNLRPELGGLSFLKEYVQAIDPNAQFISRAEPSRVNFCFDAVDTAF